MFNKEEKYTMKEFEEMFNNAEIKALESLKNAAKESGERQEGKDTSMAQMLFNMQNMLAYSELYKQLFKGEENE